MVVRMVVRIVVRIVVEYLRGRPLVVVRVGILPDRQFLVGLRLRQLVVERIRVVVDVGIEGGGRDEDPGDRLLR